jgi:hypothetical protein
VSLRRFIRHAEVYGTEYVYETASRELPRAELETLARRLATIDPGWSTTIITKPAIGGSGLANPHSEAEDCYEIERSGLIPQTRPIRNKLTVCQRCGKILKSPLRGRSRRFCSNACRQAAHRARSG